MKIDFMADIHKENEQIALTELERTAIVSYQTSQRITSFFCIYTTDYG